MLEGTPVNPDDLTDDAYELVAVVLPAVRVVDIVTDEGVVDAGLPVTYPCDAAGQLITHAACQRIAQDAHASGADGIDARSALIPVYPLATTELAWWPGAQAPAQVGERVPYGHWRAASVNESGVLFGCINEVPAVGRQARRFLGNATGPGGDARREVGEAAQSACALFRFSVADM